MARYKIVLALAPCLLLSALVACKSGSGGGATQANANTILGAGSTFVYPIMTRWISDYQRSNPAVRINYQSIGSGGGIQQLKKGLVGFGASDAPLSDEDLKQMPPLIQLPESAGPVCITYNLPGLQQLKLSADALAGIYLGRIKTWQDATIKQANPGVNLPNTPVAVVHRSDGSGTTNIFTMYLSAVSDEWKSKVGKGISVNWPAGLGGKGSEGVTGLVKQTPGAIGYVELTYAVENKLPVALVQNRAGEWVAPTPEGTTAAIDAFAQKLQSDVRTPIVDPPATAKSAYPISGLTYLLIPRQPANAAQGESVRKFVQYVVTQGQVFATEWHYSKLPDSLKEIDQKLLGELAGGTSAK